MDYNALAQLLFPQVTETPETLEQRYPPRDVPAGAVVTRMAPSPTGFVHLGNLVQGLVSERMAHQSGGVLFLRVEDTDAKREVPGAVEVSIDTLKHYGILFDEGATIDGRFRRLRSLPPAATGRDLPRLCQGTGGKRLGLPLLLHRGGAHRHAAAAGRAEGKLRLLRPLRRLAGPEPWRTSRPSWLWAVLGSFVSAPPALMEHKFLV